jgi:protein required for attachment to host cells
MTRTRLFNRGLSDRTARSNQRPLTASNVHAVIRIPPHRCRNAWLQNITTGHRNKDCGQTTATQQPNRRFRMATTWILAADSARARILEMGASGGDPREIDDLLNPDGRLQNRDINAEPDGRFYGRGERDQGHSTGHKITPVEHKTELFSKEVGRYLDNARTQHRYDRLYVIAPPEFLGLVRQNMTEETRRLVAEEINKDLSKSAPAEIGRYIHEHQRARKS